MILGGCHITFTGTSVCDKFDVFNMDSVEHQCKCDSRILGYMNTHAAVQHDRGTHDRLASLLDRKANGQGSTPYRGRVRVLSVPSCQHLCTLLVSAGHFGVHRTNQNRCAL